jgi:hypothetical protein
MSNPKEAKEARFQSPGFFLRFNALRFCVAVAQSVSE